MNNTLEANYKYPVCPECGQNSIVMFGKPKEPHDFSKLGTPEYTDFPNSHLYCSNGSSNCKFNTKITELTTPRTEPTVQFERIDVSRDTRKTAAERDMCKEERRRVARMILEQFTPIAPYATNEFVALNQFTKGYNSSHQDFVDFAWKLGALEDIPTPPSPPKNT